MAGGLVLLAAASGAVAAALGARPAALAAFVVAVVAGLAACVGWWAATGRAAAASHEAETLRDQRIELVTTVSHELRTPLTVIQGVMDTLAKRWTDLTEPERLDLLDLMIDNVASLDSSILHFVDASRLHRGEYVIEPAWLVVGPLLDRVEAKLTAALAGHDLVREIEVTELWADPDALAKIVEHLLVNALRFSAIGQPIRVRVVAGGDEVIVAVADRGAGMSPGAQKTAWLPLERGDVKESGVSRGAGLGLPIVRELARLHGGEASLSSVRGRGTTVSVRLPQPARPG